MEKFIFAKFFVLWLAQPVSLNSKPLGSLSTWRFWATDGNQKWAVFVLGLTSQYHVYIAKYLFTTGDDYFKNLCETTVLKCKMFICGLCPWLKNVPCLSSNVRQPSTLTAQVILLLWLEAWHINCIHAPLNPYDASLLPHSYIYTSLIRLNTD